MQPSTLPQWMETRAPVLPTGHRSLPTQVLLGIALAGIGVILAGASGAWNYFGVRSFTVNFAAFLQVEVLLSVAEILSLQIGLFLILWGILGILPRASLWSRLGPDLILVGAIVLAGVGFAELALYSVSYPGGSINGLLWLADVIVGAEVAGQVLPPLGLLLSLLAVAKAILLPPSSSVAPLPP